MNRIRLLRKMMNLSQGDLAKKMGVAQNTISNWENGNRKVDTESLKILAEIFGCSVDYILCNSDLSAGKKSGIRIPVLGYVKAGIPIDRIEEIVDYEEITEEMASGGDFFGLRVKGDSMEPKISEGDVVIIRKQSDVLSGEIAIVCVGGNEVAVKKILKHENGVSLVSFNHAYQPMFYTKDEVTSLPVIILGKVVELRAKF